MSWGTAQPLDSTVQIYKVSKLTTYIIMQSKVMSEVGTDLLQCPSVGVLLSSLLHHSIILVCSPLIELLVNVLHFLSLTFSFSLEQVVPSFLSSVHIAMSCMKPCLAIFFCKGLESKYSRLFSPIVSVATTQACRCSVKATTEETQWMSLCLCANTALFMCTEIWK